MRYLVEPNFSMTRVGCFIHGENCNGRCREQCVGRCGSNCMNKCTSRCSRCYRATMIAPPVDK